jgi:hypothetical protein
VARWKPKKTNRHGIDPQILSKLRDAFKKAALSEEFKAACDKIDSVVMYLDADSRRGRVAVRKPRLDTPH